MTEPSPILKQYLDLKKKHPDAILLFRCGDFYETYMQDAEKASKVLGITLTRSSKSKNPEGKPLAMAGFRIMHSTVTCQNLSVPVSEWPSVTNWLQGKKSKKARVRSVNKNLNSLT